MAALTSCGVQGKHLQGTLHAYTLRARSHTHTCSPWCAYTLQLGTTALRHTSRCTHPQTTAELHRHTPSHTDVHISGYTLTYTHTPIHVHLAISSPVPHLSCTHTHSSPHALCLGMLTHTTKYTPSQACTCSTQVWTHKHTQALFLLHSPTHHTDIHPYKSTSTYPHKHTDTHPHACRQHTDGRTDGWTDGHAPFAAGAGRCSPRIGRPWERSALYRPGDGEGRGCLICLNAITPLLSSQPSASPRPGRQPPPPTPSAPPGAARGRSPQPAGAGDIGSGHGLRA